MQQLTRRSLVFAAILALGVVSPGLGGMAELGRSGADTASGGGSVKLKVNPLFTRTVTGGDTVDQILADLANQVNTHSQNAWTATHADGSNSITVVRKDGRAIDITIEVEGTSFPEALTDTGFDRVRVSRGPGGAELSPSSLAAIGRILRTDAPAGNGSVTITVNGVPVGVSTANHDATSLLSAIAVALQGAGFPDAQVDGASVRVPGVYDLIFEESDGGIDSFGVGIGSVVSIIPTLSEWGMIALILLTLTAAMWQLRGRAAASRIRRR